jgi:hypothetical protein
MKPSLIPKDDPQTRAEVISQEEEAWKALTSTWHGLPDGLLLQPGACSPEWTIKDVMNQIATWQIKAMEVIQTWLDDRPTESDFENE